ncbi:MAG: methylenetetrahydrofolate reductase C-terminal domain-containing protein [Desulfomonile tiedjei]|uniref:Methylenetetrahydrofolate reductase C-terminal domain-containing protein n=1 Tax=Desulfomonile tiedjei TaxID=2358 RepID=A0A9D6UZ72_9BACT|nr:methylenetetrahydrofolate reductase C-terminal domain-containing protein [Desulfomonile tiedjei]
MIVAELKEIREIRNLIDRYAKILVVGCDSCVAECAAGGHRETMLLAAALKLSYKNDNLNPVITEACLDRQCVDDFIEGIAHQVPEHDAILSLGCGAGVQALARVYADKPILPALNTLFIGETEMRGIWQENCLGCGQCKLGHFGAVCPVTRCSKKLMNGPCGGSKGGKCEVNPEIRCGWDMIVRRLDALGELDRLSEYVPPVDWSTSHSGGPRLIVREDQKP